MKQSCRQSSSGKRHCRRFCQPAGSLALKGKYHRWTTHEIPTGGYKDIFILLCPVWGGVQYPYCIASYRASWSGARNQLVCDDRRFGFNPMSRFMLTSFDLRHFNRFYRTMKKEDRGVTRFRTFFIVALFVSTTQSRLQEAATHSLPKNIAL
jgi:hypothetical protein